MIYFLLNTVSKRRTKMARRAAPAPQKYTQRFLGGTVRLLRGKHYRITEEQLKAHWEELKAKQAAGALEIHERFPKGPVFAFGTLEDTSKQPEPQEEEEEEVADEAPVAEEPDDAPEGAASDEVEGAGEGDAEEGDAEAEPDYRSMTNAALISLILEHSDEWAEKELRKLKKAELLELLT